jgi:hypothetical protein
MRWIASGAAVLVAVASAAGCSASSEEPSSPFGNESGGSGTGGLFDPGSGGLGIPGGGGSGNTGPQCGGNRYDAQPAQLDIYVMFDDSGSTFIFWPGVVDVFNKFLNDPASAGIGIGLQFFGQEGQCDPGFYATPKVPIAPLPGNITALQQAFPIIPIEATPTLPAMQGAIQHARAWQQQNPTHKVVVLLVTDGLPSDCDSTIPNVAQAAALGLSGSPSIPTFVLGLGLALGDLNQVAQAGGTNQAVIADPSNATALAQAMNQIRGAALPCDYALPSSGNVDARKVNIEFTSEGGGTVTVPNVGDVTRCDASQGGWFYDNVDAPTRVVACPATCSAFKGTVSGSVNVVVGCDTVVR